MAISRHLTDKLSLLPDSPGCYIMKNERGEILYVGKAKVLKNRVRSYFHGVHNNKTTKLVAEIRDFEFIQTSTEKEALLLEINLIKKHRPPFNIMFMDDKMYPYIEVTPGPDFQVRISRKVTSKKNDYFGPFPVSTFAYDMVKLLNRLFPIRKCRSLPKSPCLYYHMHQCLGYCFQEVDEAQGLAAREKVVRFLKGNTTEIMDELKARMEKAAMDLQFEKAQEILEEIHSIEYIAEKQTIDFKQKESFDVFGWYEKDGYLSIQGFFVRDGKLLERNMSVTPIYEESVDAFHSYLLQYYQTNLIPRKIFVPEGTDTEMLSEALNTKFMVAKRGEKKKLSDLVHKNAREAHEQKFQLIYKKDQDLEQALRKMDSVFGFPVHQVELFDNSHIQGAYNVSGLVVFKDGRPDKSQYRHYQLSEYRSDTDSMKEVIRRRYSRQKKEGNRLPDLLLVDGGIGQIHAAREILNELGVDIPLAGLVKDERHSTRGLLLENGQEALLDRKEALFFLLTRMQDDVHRFAISYHQKLRGKGMTKSILDGIAGIGPARQKALKNAWPSIKKMKQATLEELEQVVPAASARLLYERLHPNTTSPENLSDTAPDSDGQEPEEILEMDGMQEIGNTEGMDAAVQDEAALTV